MERVWGLSAVLLFCACSDTPTPTAEKRGSPPPPAASAKAPSACTRSAIDDAETKAFFPQKVGGFCLDPADGGTTFGENGKQPLDAICNLFDGECDVYKGLDVSRVVQFRYVDEKGGAATIDVIASRFASPAGAYAMFTKRTVGDGDPADPATPRATKGGGVAALGVGNAYLWRGAYLVEVTYNDETAAEPAIRSAADALLPSMIEQIGDKLPGDKAVPAEVAALPEPDRLPMGVRYVTKDALGVAGLGPGAYGYYKAGDVRHRVLAMSFADETKAKAAMALLAKQKGARPEASLGDEAVRLLLKEGALDAEWIVARRGTKITGVGDEIRVMRGGMPAEEIAKISLSSDDKKKRLTELVK